MKLSSAIKMALATSVVVLVSGCSSMMSVGDDEFSCQNGLDGAPCVSAREAYALTHTKDRLTVEDSERVVAEREAKKNKDSAPVVESSTIATQSSSSNGVTNSKTSNPIISDYISGKDSVELYAKSEQMLNQMKENQLNGTYIMPGLMRQPSEVMRVWFSPRQDENENFHMDKNVYVEIEPKKWVFGEKGINVKPNVTPMTLTNPYGVQSGVNGLSEKDFVQGKEFGGNMGGNQQMMQQRPRNNNMSGFGNQMSYGSGSNSGRSFR